MIAPLLPRRFLLRLALPLAGMAAMLAMAEPLPAPAPDPITVVREAVNEEVRATTERVRLEAAQLQMESQDAAQRARASAAAMRWLITLPAASGRRCLVDSCAD